MKFLIAGLGNIGPEYSNTRHNAGFQILDAFAEASGAKFEDRRFAFISKIRLQSESLLLVKPSTFVNLSGIAINYWLKKEKIQIENFLVIVDDVALPFGTLRIRARGGDGGHNGLTNITQLLGTRNYSRLRFGTGNEFLKGRQISFVLGTWTKTEGKVLPEKITVACDIIRSFVLAGIEKTMNLYNKK